MTGINITTECFEPTLSAFLIVRNQVTFGEAITICESLNQTMANVQNIEEYNFLTPFFDNNSITGGIRLGLQRTEPVPAESRIINFESLDGSLTDFIDFPGAGVFPWSSENPNNLNSGSNQDCVV